MVSGVLNIFLSPHPCCKILRKQNASQAADEFHTCILLSLYLLMHSFANKNISSDAIRRGIPSLKYKTPLRIENQSQQYFDSSMLSLFTNSAAWFLLEGRIARELWNLSVANLVLRQTYLPPTLSRYFGHVVIISMIREHHSVLGWAFDIGGCFAGQGTQQQKSQKPGRDSRILS